MNSRTASDGFTRRRHAIRLLYAFLRLVERRRHWSRQRALAWLQEQLGLTSEALTRMRNAARWRWVPPRLAIERLVKLAGEVGAPMRAEDWSPRP